MFPNNIPPIPYGVNPEDNQSNLIRGGLQNPGLAMPAAPPMLPAVPKLPKPSPEQFQAVLAKMQQQRKQPAQSLQMQMPSTSITTPEESPNMPLPAVPGVQLGAGSNAYAEQQRQQRIMDEVYKSFGLK